MWLRSVFFPYLSDTDIIFPLLSKQDKNATSETKGKHTLETVPFSSTNRGALLLTGWGSGWSRHRQQKRLEKRPLLLGFLEDREGEDPAEEEEDVTTLIYKINVPTT